MLKRSTYLQGYRAVVLPSGSAEVAPSGIWLQLLYSVAVTPPASIMPWLVLVAHMAARLRAAISAGTSSEVGNDMQRCIQ